ncbi:MAG: hypothetical protein IPL55_07535 [Saprospiraceae bacterium]|nr:hypothetical protein [Saprospiraceae bacterium]
MLLSPASLPPHNAPLPISWLRHTYLSGACSIAFRCVHLFTGKAAYCLSHRPDITSTTLAHIVPVHRVCYTLYPETISLA